MAIGPKAGLYQNTQSASYLPPTLTVPFVMLLSLAIIYIHMQVDIYKDTSLCNQIGSRYSHQRSQTFARFYATNNLGQGTREHRMK